jgi:hypothetical protein
MIWRFLRRRWAYVRASIRSALERSNNMPAGDDSQAAIAAQLRAQIPCSTDPTRLERLAREAEARARG